MTELLPRHRYTEYTDGPLGHYVRAPESVGLTSPVPPLQRSADGQIDYDHYLRLARAERSRAAKDIFKAIGRGLTSLFNGALFSRQRLSGPRHI